MLLMRVRSRWERFSGRPLDFFSRFQNSLCSLWERLSSTRSRPLLPSQTTTVQTIFQGIRFQMAGAARRAIQAGMATPPPAALAVDRDAVGGQHDLDVAPGGVGVGANPVGGTDQLDRVVALDRGQGHVQLSGDREAAVLSGHQLHLGVDPDIADLELMTAGDGG